MALGHAQISQQESDGLRGHRAPVIRVYCEFGRVRAFLADRLREQNARQRRAFAVSHHPADKASGARELHPRALSEPYVSLSTHTAPIIQSLLTTSPSVQRASADDVQRVGAILCSAYGDIGSLY